MNLLQTIINYYHGEARHGFWAAIIGGLLLIGSMVLWKWASPLPLLKGFAVPMLLFGLLMGIGGAADNIYTKKSTPGKIALYQKDSTAFLKQEKVKIEKTHRGWHGIRIFWGILGFGGVLFSLLIRKPFWIGAGLGTVALAIFLSPFEFYSMRFNERYYHAIQSATLQEANNNAREIHTDTQQQATIQQTQIDPQVNEHKYAKPETNTLPRNTATRDSIKALSAPDLTTVVITDSVNFNSPDDLKLPVLANEVAQISPQETVKEKKVLDYYNTDLIQANGVNAKHCWFSKNYIKQ
jgi:hypothetical protein